MPDEQKVARFAPIQDFLFGFLSLHLLDERSACDRLVSPEQNRTEQSRKPRPSNSVRNSDSSACRL